MLEGIAAVLGIEGPVIIAIVRVAVVLARLIIGWCSTRVAVMVLVASAPVMRFVGMAVVAVVLVRAEVAPMFDERPDSTRAMSVIGTMVDVVQQWQQSRCPKHERRSKPRGTPPRARQRATHRRAVLA